MGQHISILLNTVKCTVKERLEYCLNIFKSRHINILFYGPPSRYIYLHVSLHISVYLSIRISLSIHPYIHESHNPPICLPIYFSLSLSIHFIIYPSVCLSIYLYICLSVYLPTYQSRYELASLTETSYFLQL